MLISSLSSPEQMLDIGFDFIFNDVTPLDCLMLIRQNKMLSTETISQFKGFDITPFAEYIDDVDKTIKKLSERRSDIASVIVNHPDGMRWLKSQLALIKEKLMPENYDDFELCLENGVLDKDLLNRVYSDQDQ